MQEGKGHVPQLLDLLISHSSNPDSNDTRIFMVQEYFDYDLRSLIINQLSQLTPDQIISIVY